MLLMHEDGPVPEIRREEEKQEEVPLRLELLPDGMLRLTLGREEHKVKVHRCFPWSEPLELLSLRDLKNQERALIKNLDELDGNSRGALVQAIAESQFCFAVEDVLSIDEEYEMRTWMVKTAQGPRRFQTKLDEWPKSVPGGGLVIRDVHGDLYLIARPADLPEHARRLFD